MRAHARHTHACKVVVQAFAGFIVDAMLSLNTLLGRSIPRGAGRNDNTVTPVAMLPWELVHNRLAALNRLLELEG